MMNRQRLLLLLGSLAVSSCVLPYRGIAPSQYGGPMDWQQGGRYRSAQPGHPPTQEGMMYPAPEPRELYGWDGGVVTDEHVRGVEAPATGRTHVLELCQEVTEERDALREEVEALNEALRRSEEKLTGQRGDASSLNAQIEALKMEQERLLTQNQELASRLTTAQIRRLEAEKLLLEMRIDSHKAAKKSSTGMETTGGFRPGSDPSR